MVTTRLDFDQFRAKCLSIHKDHKILSDDEAKAFFDYWTEGHPETKPRYASADRFDIAKRMGTWKRNNFGSTAVTAKGKTAMTKADAEAWIEKYKERLGLKPGDAIPTAEIPNDIYHAWRGYAKS